MNQSSNSDLTFEEAMKKLEEIVKHLESGELPLSESIAAYKESLTLVQFCRQQLDKAEFEIEQLSGDGTTQPIAAKEEA